MYFSHSLRSMLGFLRTCVRLYADASKSARDRVLKMFLKKLFGMYSSRISSVFYVSKPTPIKYHKNLGLRFRKVFFPPLRSMLVLLRGQYEVQHPIRKTQQHRAFIPFFRTHNLSSNLTKKIELTHP